MLKKIVLPLVILSSLFLTGCTQNKVSTNQPNTNTGFTVQSCIKAGGEVSYSIDPAANKSKEELAQQLRSGTVELTIVCPKGKQKIGDIEFHSGDIENQICCK